jgi:hypothetical protein
LISIPRVLIHTRNMADLCRASNPPLWKKTKVAENKFNPKPQAKAFGRGSVPETPACASG